MIVKLFLSTGVVYCKKEMVLVEYLYDRSFLNASLKNDISSKMELKHGVESAW